MKINHDELKKVFGKNLREIRKGKKLSQEQLAEKADLHPTYIGAVERGEQSPTLDTIGKIANALEIHIRDLFAFSTDTKEKIKNEILTCLGGKNQKSLRKVLNIVRVIDE